ncbi:DUF5946 family protein [Flavitalea sp. BT771]|uniref:DUF5946 family protein n=1 Tax=Flavitalea sp. BT771 TaxID=3063329 RepID=UPI0026E32808|nr:DUF5946 family protein [Flavitalea sp. BT771]MDO6430269.1 DUF5946 family protein [Flavitalea sp. BT771]MDV6219591.1 DUF5946 family protein [Flavitalea sp. BT771]
MAMKSYDLYTELSYYTLSHSGSNFIHQHIVDAYTVQTATSTTKPIALWFGLVGLYLYVEKGYTGRQVQQMHGDIAKRTKEFPAVDLPQKRGNITVADVLQKPPGPARDQMIEAWCAAVWEAFKENREVVTTWLFY